MNAIAALASAETRHEGWARRAVGSISCTGHVRDVSPAAGMEDTQAPDSLADAIRQARLAAVGEERARIARELHDTLLQSFTGVTLQLQALRKRILASPHEAEQGLGSVLEIADRALRDARMAIWEMRTPQTDGGAIAAMLEESARELIASHRLAASTPVDLQLVITGECRRLPRQVETAAYRIAREAMVNAVTHARARHIRVVIAFEPGRLGIEVCDDGLGFDVALLDPRVGCGHWGIAGMRERANDVRGSLDIASSPHEGTSVTLCIPVAPRGRESADHGR